MTPDFSIEAKLAEQFKNSTKEILIAGVDEAGCGALAGPVVAAAVILNPEYLPHGINDSKKLSAKKRKYLANIILSNHHVAVTYACKTRIIRDNIRQATLWAMAQAINALTPPPNIVMIDGPHVPINLKCQTVPIIKGDTKSLSIAAASIVAKVCRDAYMVEAAKAYPGYGFEKHVGYGTKMHLQSILQLGPCRIHRDDFAPLQNNFFIV